MKFALPKSLAAWNTQCFKSIFKQEVSALNYQHLPLQQGLSLSSYVSNDNISAIINSSIESESHINIYTSIFYTGVIAGCSCSDDPTPLDTQNEYCELCFSINKLTAETTATLLAD